MKALRLFIVLVLLAATAGLVMVYSGAYNVAASEPHTPLMGWLLDRAKERSVAVRAEALATPALDDPRLLQDGARHYAANCEVCHGGPGVEPGEIGRGLTPPPPKLTERTRDWSPKEVFWIVKHGIKMTGMPAWGETHRDEELWAVTAFVEALPGMSPSAYRELIPEGGADRGREHEHRHG